MEAFSEMFDDFCQDNYKQVSSFVLISLGIKHVS